MKGRQAPAAPIPLWPVDAQGQITAVRDAAHWYPAKGRAVECTLCYRRCRLEVGEEGWCGYRANERGRMVLPEHGVLARCQRQMLGYRGGIRTFMPGARALAIGALRCTAACSFCASSAIVHRPERMEWLGGRMRGYGYSGGWHYIKSMAHPSGVIATAQQWGARAITFAENEPLLSWEYTFDVARLAQAAGLKVVIYTNGFSTPAAVRTLAPFVDCVDLGIKGSLDADFYARHMRAPGAVDAVKASALEWKRAGVYMVVSDLIPASHMQTDDAQQAAQHSLYDWIAAELGPQSPILIGPMVIPKYIRGEAVMQPDQTPFIKGRDDTDEAYGARIAAAWGRATAAGLPYAHILGYKTPMCCHACGGVVLDIVQPSACGDMRSGRCAMFSHYCDCWRVVCNVTGGRCTHCNERVPIVEA